MAALSITGLSLAQAVDGSARVHVTGALVGTTGPTSLGYLWKETSGSFAAATVTAPASASADGALDFYWDLDNDYHGDATTAGFVFEVTASANAVPATGSITLVSMGGTNLADGDTVSLLGKTYEFSVDGTAQGSNIPVKVTASSSAAQVRDALAKALVATGDVTVKNSGAAQLLLTAAVPGAAGNGAITVVAATATVPVVALAGGIDAVTATASANLAAAATGTVGDLVQTNPQVPTSVLGSVFFKYVPKHDETHGAGEGVTDFLRNSILYSALDQLTSGKYQKIDYVNDRSMNMVKRAVLVSVAEFQRVTPGLSLPVIPKSKQWLAYKAWRAFSRLFATKTNVYAIYEMRLVREGGQLNQTQTIVGYLLSAEYYESLVH